MQDTVGAAEDETGGPSPAKKKAVRWLEWPTKGGGQYATAISERALKSSMTLPGEKWQSLMRMRVAALLSRVSRPPIARQVHAVRCSKAILLLGLVVAA